MKKANTTYLELAQSRHRVDEGTGSLTDATYQTMQTYALMSIAASLVAIERHIDLHMNGA